MAILTTQQKLCPHPPLTSRNWPTMAWSWNDRSPQLYSPLNEPVETNEIKSLIENVFRNKQQARPHDRAFWVGSWKELTL
jgi:hypothetical protein